MNEFVYKHEYNTIEEISALITEKPVFENLPTPFKETTTDDGTDIWSAEPNVPGYVVSRLLNILRRV